MPAHSVPNDLQRTDTSLIDIGDRLVERALFRMSEQFSEDRRIELMGFPHRRSG